MINQEYKERVRLLLRIIPIISTEECFAVHGGTAINLFVQNLPRYSVDIDLTYIPVEPREASLAYQRTAESDKGKDRGCNTGHCNTRSSQQIDLHP